MNMPPYYWLILVIIPLGTYLMKALIMNRLEQLEKDMSAKITRSEVKETMEEKLDPIREDLQDIKSQLNKLFDLYVNDRRGFRG